MEMPSRAFWMMGHYHCGKKLGDAALQALTGRWGNYLRSLWQQLGRTTCRNSRIVGITLATMDLIGQLSGDLQLCQNSEFWIL
ncbi:hypothetical protein SOVF_148370 [Spinacia oleracea]|uniref:Uncharacterized protein isoform X2 n=1 Tax=Spinacia oleracea TaxID=3562 RepID=A0A9R0J297_SPIOL|nr:uncharacterized protein LOC110797782 isoform X2 [Spinacia oleracea]KNA10005.1 hypothetical protein SOVF_148370 [Spinacia oleracea]